MSQSYTLDKANDLAENIKEMVAYIKDYNDSFLEKSQKSKTKDITIFGYTVFKGETIFEFTENMMKSSRFDIVPTELVLEKLFSDYIPISSKINHHLDDFVLLCQSMSTQSDTVLVNVSDVVLIEAGRLQNKINDHKAKVNELSQKQNS